MEKVNYAGSCLCGAVAYEVETRPRNFYFCHCQQCRKLSGSAHASNILCEPAEVNWLRGLDKIKRFDAADGRQFTHVFCTECGSGLPFLNGTATSLIIPAGGLDSTVMIEVGHNIFWNEVPRWYEEGLSAERCEGFPENRANRSSV